MSNPINWILIIVGAVLVLLEVLLGAISGFDFLLLGSAILLGGVLGIFTGNGVVGLAAAGVLSLLYVFVGRKRIRNRLKRPSLPSNTDALIGRTAIVSEAITSDAGSLDVVVASLGGAQTSSVAYLTVVSPPVILSSPASQTVSLGQETIFCASATNDCGGQLTYQWRFNGAEIAGATSKDWKTAGVTIFQDTRLSTAVPQSTAFLPPAFMATLPPMQEASAEVGSTAKTRPAASACSMTRRVTTPAPQRITGVGSAWPGRTTSSMADFQSSFSVLITAALGVSGTAPPV